jgi:hypothetical protein
MTPWYKWAFALVTLAVTISGGAFFVMKYCLEPADPFAVVNHPLQPLMLHVHVLSSPALLLMFGALLQGHVAGRLRQAEPANRRSGMIAAGSFAVMAVSGYLLQVVVSTSLSRGLVVAHVASGAIFAVSYGAHLVVSLVLARRRSSTIPASPLTPGPSAAGQI